MEIIMEHIESYPPVNEDMFAEDDSLDTSLDASLEDPSIHPSRTLDTSLPGAQYVQTNVGVERS